MIKAFESVNHRILLNKLSCEMVPLYAIKILEVLFKNITLSVSYGGTYYRNWNIKSGVRQGGILSAFLFSYYIDDIVKRVAAENIGCRLGITKVTVQAYADDIAQVAPTAGGLKILLDVISKTIDDHKLLFNTDKIKVVIFRPRCRSICPALVFLMNGQPIEIANSFKYLGCILSSDSNDSLDIDRCKNVFNRQFGLTYRRFYSVNKDVFYSLFLSFCGSFFMDLSCG